MNGKPKHWPGKPLGPPDGRHLEAQFTPEWKRIAGRTSAGNPPPTETVVPLPLVGIELYTLFEWLLALGYISFDPTATSLGHS